MSRVTRREALRKAGQAAAVSVVAGSFIDLALGADGVVSVQAAPQSTALNAIAGVDRIVMKSGKTYLNAWAGYGTPRRGRAGGRGNAAAAPEPPPGPAPTTEWRKVSGPGTVTFADPKAPVTTAKFSDVGEYVLEVVADNGTAKVASSLSVRVEYPPPRFQLQPVVTRKHTVTSPFWKSRTKALITSWIPHCVAQIERTDLVQGPNSGAGGLDNFIEAAKALKGQPHDGHKGYVFSNAWVHQTVESISLALMVDPEGDPEIIAAQAKLRQTLDRWIPIILSAQEPDGYLQTAYTLRDKMTPGSVPAADRAEWTQRWQATARGNHEGYVSGYFIESAINHYMMTDGKDRRLFDAARKLADCWVANIGPAPKKTWFDGHQEMEQALVRFGRFVNEIEGKPWSGSGPIPAGPGDPYIQLAKFLLDSRQNGSEYDQSHLPVQQQYEAVGHAVRAVYTYSGMADVAVETHDTDYQSAVRSIWDNIVHRKYYLTGGVGSGESSEGFGPNYSLRNSSYCEACSSCGEIFFQWKMHLAYQEAQYADLYEQTLYNALYGAMDLKGTTFYYTNPLDANAQRNTWHSCPCCVGNMARTMLMLPTWTYSKSPSAVHVNLFAGGRVDLGDVAGTDVEIEQITNYPWDGKVKLVVHPKAPAEFAIRIRSPRRDVSSLYRATPAADGVTAFRLNGRAMTPQVREGYLSVARRWAKGDTIEFELPMPVQRVYGSDKIVGGGTLPPPVKGKVALRVGPLVYNVEAVDQNIDQALSANAPLKTEWRGDLLGGLNVVTGTFAGGAAMLAIPNFARYNRNPPAPPPAPPAPPPAPGSPAPPRPAPPPVLSKVWITEA